MGTNFQRIEFSGIKSAAPFHPDVRNTSNKAKKFCRHSSANSLTTKRTKAPGAGELCTFSLPPFVALRLPLLVYGEIGGEKPDQFSPPRRGLTPAGTPALSGLPSKSSWELPADTLPLLGPGSRDTLERAATTNC